MSLENCNEITLDFVVKEDDPEMAAIEDDIRKNLAKIGITVNARFLGPEDYGNAEKLGDFNLMFGRTWGAPYDPHSYLSSFAVPSHFEHMASLNLEAPVTQDQLIEKIESVTAQSDTQVIQEKWKEILEDIHAQAVFLPLWGTRIPYLVSRRLIGFEPSAQAFSYPLDSVQVVSGSGNVTAAVGSGGALFGSIGPLNPHQYFPNQLFAQAWVYEGLVGYGQDGEVTPALATSWSSDSTATGGQRVTFTLRENVKFHDGADFNCAAAKLNFDHVLHETVKERHSWFQTPNVLTSWTCNDQDQFVLETATPYYPLLQELSYIRPLVMASPNSFANGLDSDATTQNSCNAGDFGSKYTHLEDTVTCAGLTAPVGTGPFKFASREYLDDEETIDKEVVFARHEEYWGRVPGIENLVVQHFDNTDEVEAALLDGSLDLALGTGTLSATQVQSLKYGHSDKLDVRHSGVLRHALLALNTARVPTNDIDVRRAIIHAVDKGTFVEKEFANVEQPVDQLLPQTAPFCNVELFPKWNYDPEKAELINCPTDESGLSSGGKIGVSVGVIAIIALIGFIFHLVSRERSGKPVFAREQADKAEHA